MNVMPVREFLRGGYRKLKGPTVISRHGVPVFTVFPPFDRKSALLAASIERDFSDLFGPSNPADQLAAGEGDQDESSEEVPAQDQGQ